MTGSVIGLFAGVGGIELGLARSGFQSNLLCELDPAAQSILQNQFPDAELTEDVRTLKGIGSPTILSAGFPCQDLSQAGPKVGITGGRSGLVSHIFRLIDEGSDPEWLILENVSYMLRLNKGWAMRHIVTELEDRGFRWAYRSVDARAFGVPQRRQRVLVVASRSHDPSNALFADNYVGDEPNDSVVGEIDPELLYGFYWTEGRRGLGWVRDGTPTVKGGSSIGIPSPPAIWDPSTRSIGTPSIQDAERLQGFSRDWTQPIENAGFRASFRWRLVGNAVCVPMAEWLGRRIAGPGESTVETGKEVTDRWPQAASGGPGSVPVGMLASMYPTKPDYSLRAFLMDDLKPLSKRATAGFLSRASKSTSLRFADGFLEDGQYHLKKVSNESATTASRS